MSLPIAIAIVAANFFGAIAIYLSLREDKAQRLLREYIDDQKKQAQESKLLREINNRIDYYLDIEKIILVIMENLDDLVKYSAVSSMILSDDKIIFRTHAAEAINHLYIEDVKKTMLLSLSHLTTTPLDDIRIHEETSGKIIEESGHFPLESYFHLPFLVNEQTTALITVSTTRHNRFTEKEMVVLYNIINRSSKAFKHLQTALNIEKSKLKAMVESLSDGLLMVDTENNISSINPTARHFLSLNKEHPTLFDVLSTLPINYDFRGKIQAAIQEQKTSEIKEITLHDKILTVTITPVHNTKDADSPTALGASIMLHDITLKKSVAQMKEDFTNIIVHELRSPLTSIKAGSQLLLNNSQLSHEERTKLMRLVYEQANKMLDEVSLILDAAKLEAGLFTVVKAPADLKAVIQEKVSVFQPPAQEKLINLSTEIDPGLPAFSFDEHHIGQVLNNLISNSLKFTSGGGSIKVTAKQHDGKVYVSVSDTGMGIPKEKQHLLFSRFSQISAAGTHTGTGLGLYIVKGVIEAHGGTVSLESDEGHGTTIVLTLPIEAHKTLATEIDKNANQSSKMVN